jgi:hypothetical protein
MLGAGAVKTRRRGSPGFTLLVAPVVAVYQYHNDVIKMIMFGLDREAIGYRSLGGEIGGCEMPVSARSVTGQ